MTRIARFHLIAAMILHAVATTAWAQPWELRQVITPPSEAGYGPNDAIGFGRTTALSGQWLAVGAIGGHCGSMGIGSVLMYRRDPVTRDYVFVQQICGAGPGTSIALWQDWLMLGWPHQDNTPGDNMQNGRVSFLRWNESSRHWNSVQTADGAADSLMGYSVAMRSGVAVAGESGYQNDRGRVRSWRLSSNGSQWTSEGWVYRETVPLRPIVAEGFGASVDLDIRGCRAPTCNDPLDALAVLSASGIYTFERLAAGWGQPTRIAPARGTTTAFTDIAMNDSLVIATAIVQAGDPLAPCTVGIVSSEVRVLRREPGSVRLRNAGFACRQQLGIAPTRQFVSQLALADEGSEFHFGIPDYPANHLGVVSTWDASAAGVPPIPTDAIVDPDFTSLRHAETGSSLYLPALAGDYFGSGVAIHDDTLVIGAPYYNGFLMGHGSGYVVVYGR